MNGVNPRLEGCSICQTSYTDQTLITFNRNLTVQDLVLILDQKQMPTQIKCGHIFHSNCLHQWIETFKHKTDIIASCPSCRASLMDQPFEQIISVLTWDMVIDEIRQDGRDLFPGIIFGIKMWFCEVGRTLTFCINPSNL